MKKLFRNAKIFGIKLLNSILALVSNRYGFKSEEYKYFESYADEQCVNRLGGAVVAMFDGRQVHCGLTDRLIGISTAYEFSKRLNLPFYIYFKSPFQLTNYLLPNNVNWLVDENDVLYNKNASIPVFINNWQSLTVFHWFYVRMVAFRNPCKQIHMYINSPYHIKRYSANFKTLFKMSPLLECSIAKSLAEIGSSSYTAMAFRFAGILGDFREDYSNFSKLSKNEKSNILMSCERKLLQLRNELGLKERILITADSQKFLEHVKKYDFVYTTPGGVAHIDNPHERCEDVYLKIFVDLILLSKARFIYQLHTGGMYRASGFARQASKLGGVGYLIVNFKSK